MLSYDVKVGYSCNNRCRHCVIDDSKDRLIAEKEEIDLSTVECIRLIDIAARNGATGVVLTGGEVSIRKDFGQLLQACIRKGLAITIQSNGRMFSRDATLTLVKGIDKIRFVIALHGNDPNTHDKITQVAGSFQETCEGIKSLVLSGKMVILKVVISKLNQNELPGIVLLAHQLGVKYICFAFPHGQGGARKNFSQIIPRYRALQPLFEQVIEVANIYSIHVEFETVPFCIIPYHMKLVGELKYLRGDSMYTQVREGTRDWGKVRKSIKRKAAMCKQCSLNVICEGPWSEYIEAFGDLEFKPIHFSDEAQNEILKRVARNFERKTTG